MCEICDASIKGQRRGTEEQNMSLSDYRFGEGDPIHMQNHASGF